MGLVTHNKNKYDEGTKISEYFSLPELVEKPLTDKKKETLKSFLTNNLELNESIKSNSSKIPITPLSKIELMIMYLKLNINTLKEMDFDNKELIIDIVENDNYLIIEFDIYSNDKLISI